MTATNDRPEHYRNRYLCRPWCQVDHDADARVLGLDFRPLGDSVIHSTFHIEGRDARGADYDLGAAQGVEMTHDGRADANRGTAADVAPGQRTRSVERDDGRRSGSSPASFSPLPDHVDLSDLTTP